MFNKNYLKPGDLLQVISPSGCLRELDALKRGIQIWRSHGYKVELTPNYDEQWGYLAGTDESRCSQLVAAINNENCRGILCSRGGYGATRILENWQGLNNCSSSTPKWLIGFSDVTALLWTFSKMGFLSIHGPLLATLSAEPEWPIQRSVQISRINTCTAAPQREFNMASNSAGIASRSASLALAQ